MLKTNSVAGCSPSSDLGRTQKVWEPLIYSQSCVSGWSLFKFR